MTYNVMWLCGEKELLLFTTEYLHVAKGYCDELNSDPAKMGLYIVRTVEGA